MTIVTDIIFGDPVRFAAKAAKGKLEAGLITISRADSNVQPEGALDNTDERMKVQWSESGRPQKQIRRRVVGNGHLIAVHLHEKEE